MSLLKQVELVLIERILSQKPRPPDEHFFISSIIFSRPCSDLLLMTCRQAFANLAWQRAREQIEGKISYNIFTICSTGLLNAMVLQPDSFNRDIRWDYDGRIKIVREEVAPIERTVIAHTVGQGDIGLSVRRSSFYLRIKNRRSN